MFNSPGDSSDNKGLRRGSLFDSDEVDSDDGASVGQSSDEEMWSSPAAKGRQLSKAFTPEESDYGAAAASVEQSFDGMSSEICLSPGAGGRPRPSAVGFTPPGRPRPVGFTPKQPASGASAAGEKPPPAPSARTPMGLPSAAGFDCTPVNQRPTNAEITGALTKDKVIFFDFDGVLSPVGLVSDREDFKPKRIDIVYGSNIQKIQQFNDGIEARREKLMILKQQYSLCICSQNIHGNIVTFCNKYYLDFFDVIIGKKKGRDKIIKQDEMLNVLCGKRALFIDDSQGEIDAITKGGDITARQIPKWTLNSKPAVLPVEPVGPVELKLRF